MMRVSWMVVGLLVISVASLWAQPGVVLEGESDNCTIQTTTDEKWHAIDMRVTHKVVGTPCLLNEEETVGLVADVLDAVGRKGDVSTYTGFRVGSVEDYAWMQKYLMDTAREDVNWVRETGGPKSGHANTYVNEVLSRPAVMSVFNKAGEQQDVRFEKMDCEKVFISEEGLPIDAFCWAEFEQE